MKNKSLFALFVFGLVFVAMPALVFADETNETTNQTSNATTNVTSNVTENVTANVTTNTTENVTTNVTNNSTNVTTNVTSNVSNVTTNVTTNTTNVTSNVTSNVTTNSTNNSTNNSSDDEDEVDLDDVALGKTNHGMEVRLLQLKKSLTRNTEHAELIFDEIDNQNFSVDTDVLDEILDDLEDLNEQIDDLLSEEPVNVSAEKFVNLKAQAINLTHQFKVELYSILTPQELNVIKSALKDDFEKNEKSSKRMNELKQKISQKAKEHNIEQALKIYNKYELNNSALLAKIEAQNISSKELREELKEDFNEMRKKQKEKAEDKIEQEREEYKKEKAKISGKQLRLNSSDVEDILNDDSLTWEEKEAKLRILAQERKASKQSNELAEDWDDEDEQENESSEDLDDDEDRQGRQSSKRENRGE